MEATPLRSVPHLRRSAMNSTLDLPAYMNPRDIFGIIIRTFGLSLFVYAIWFLAYGIATVAGLPEDVPGYKVGYFITGGVHFAIGLYLLRGAPGIIRFSYPSHHRGKQNQQAEQDAALKQQE